MEEAANIILTKLNLVNPTLSPFSAYQQSAEIRQLWSSVESSIRTILTVTSTTFSSDPLDASSQIITVLSASTLLSSIIHAIISTQKRINRADEIIESVIQKEAQVIWYHVQILKQDLNQSLINAESAQEAIIHHTNILVDSLVAYSLTPSNTAFQIHPYKVSPSSSINRRYSQPLNSISQSSSIDELSQHPYSNNEVLNREKSGNSVGKKFMKSINSLKYRPKTLLPSRQSIEPTNPEQPPNKKRIFYDRINEEDDHSDDGSLQTWDDDSSSNHSINKNKGGTATLRFLLNGGKQQQQQQQKQQKANKRASKGIKELLLNSESGKKKRESISTFFNSQNKKESRTKELESKKESSFYSSSTISGSSESMKLSNDVEQKGQHLISPFSKKTNIHWSSDEFEQDQLVESIERKQHVRESYRIEPIHKEDEEDSESSCDQTAMHLKREKSRKRRSNGSLVSPLVLKSPAVTMKTEFPLPPLPTVENFLTIMNSPDSNYNFTATRSISSTSTENSGALDDVTDSLASTQILEPGFSLESNSSSQSNSTTSSSSTVKKSADEQLESDIDDDFIEKNLKKAIRMSYIPPLPPPVPPKDQLVEQDKKKKKKIKSDGIKINTSDSNRFSFFTSPKSADITKKTRPSLPLRRSSMPLVPPPKSEDAIPPLPTDAKKITDSYNKKSTKSVIDESPWSSFLGINNKKEESTEVTKTVKLRRSLGTTRKLKKQDSKKNNGQMLKITENGQVVLLYEMVDGKFQIIAGTPERLFEKLADETTQDMNYVDTYIMYHSNFTTSDELLNQLICRFHLGPSPGEYEYFKKWQHSIQTKVLNVIDRWITIQYQDFKFDITLQKKLNLFLINNDVHFKQQVEKIQYTLKNQMAQYNITNHITNQNNFQFPFANSSQQVMHHSNIRRPSNGLFNKIIQDSSIIDVSVTSILSFESKDIARYLTLADYYMFKSILSRGLLNDSVKKEDSELDYIDLMTKRSNIISHWVVHEICSLSFFKPKRALVKKFIEIAKLCLDFNNYHTCMVITMGLASAPKLKEVWESISSRDTNTFSLLQKLLDVSMNMRHYRQKIQLSKSPCIPFLPVVLKDQTFFKENSTFLVSHPNLINFSKFISMRQFIDKTKDMMNEPYWFANELSHYPFIPNSNSTVHNNSLDPIADWIEGSIRKVQDCYLQCDLLLNL